MTGFWLISYMVLWVLFILFALLLLGALQQIGVLRRQLGLTTADQNPALEAFPSDEEDGPVLGSLLPEMTLESMNGSGTYTLRENTQSTLLLMFLSTTCPGCQKVVDPLNTLIESQRYSGRVLVVLRGDDQMCQAFLKVFPLRAPVIQDRHAHISKGFDVHRNPFGLLYDAAGMLVGKGTVARYGELIALLGEQVRLAEESTAR
jgi:methylamine dehydrogenase accessory protein MauD